MINSTAAAAGFNLVRASTARSDMIALMNLPATNRKRRPAPGWFVAALVMAMAASASALQPENLPRERWSALANAPLYFEANRDGDAARFIARGRDCNVWLSPDRATLEFGSAEPGTRTVRLTLSGANPAAEMSGREVLPGKANYFIGNDTAGWRTGVPLFSRVQVGEVYPGIDVVYYADEAARLEYDFLLRPHAPTDQIRFLVEGADRIRVDGTGDLVLTIGDDEVRQHRPIIYQESGGVRKPIAGGYRLAGPRTVGFWLGDYDRSSTLVIDPTLSFSTYLGGSKQEIGWAIAVDTTGNIYVAGETLSKKLSLPGAITSNFQGTNYNGGKNAFGDAFVAKYNAVSNQLVYLTYLGGRTDDGALGIFADAGGNAYVTGFTDSRNFPIIPTNGAIRPFITGNSNNAFRLPMVDAFVTALDPAGSTILFSTFLGGTRRDSGTAITGDGTGIYVTGYTESTNFFPITNAVQQFAAGNGDAFVTKLDLSGTAVLYSTYLGGTNFDSPEGIAVNGGSVYVTGTTFSTNFPSTNPIVFNGITYTNLNTQTNFTAASDAFVSRLDPAGSPLVYSTYLGGSNNDGGLQIAVDGAGNAFVTGYTFSKNFPTNTITTPPSPATNFVSHAFVTEIAPGGTTIIASTEFGGNGADQGTGIALDAGGNVYVAGITTSTNFFGTNVFTDLRAASTNSAGKKIKVTNPNNVFVAVLSPDLATFVSTNSVMLGGAGDDQANGLALNPAGPTAYVVGVTASPNLPTTNSVMSTLVQTNLGGAKKGKLTDAFVIKIEYP
jgi:beta-propeller repeat-containing protein